jgi:hypothetical protein
MKYLLLLVSVVLFAKPASAIEPMNGHIEFTDGSSITYIKPATGKEYKFRFFNGENNTIISVNNKGCREHSSIEAGFPFVPPHKFENCGNTRKDKKVFLVSDSPVYPLKVGNKWSYSDVEGKENDNYYEVVGVETVNTSLGRIETYKVVYNNPYGDWVYYMSPEYGTYVKNTRFVRSQNSTYTFELLKLNIKPKN